MTQLIVFSGLPGAGKSTVAEALARHMHLAVVSIDPIEAAMWQSGIAHNQTGIAAYEVAAAVAAEQLRLGQSVIADAVNPVAAARGIWRQLADKHGASLKIIEVTCSDEQLHHRRIEDRQRNITGMPEVTWERVQERRREYEPWREERLVLDSTQPLEALVAQTIVYLRS